MMGKNMLRSRALLRGFVSVLLLLLLPAALFAQRPRQMDKSIPATRYIPSHDFDTQNIKLELHFDWSKQQAIGIETITGTPLLTDLKTVELDIALMTINSVKLSNGTTLKFSADLEHEKLSIALDRAYQPGEVIVMAIDYHTNGVTSAQGLAGFGRGLAFIQPTPEDAARPRQIWSQGESEYNHYWFPCYDHPNDFTTTEIDRHG